MKLIKLFGIVAAAHAILFMFIFAVPGCRSTSKNKPAPIVPASDPASPFVGSAESSPVGTVSAATGESTPMVRFSPTRPGTLAAESATAVVTPVATTYAVAKGDNLWSIAKKNGVTVKELTAANNLRADSMLKLGQKLIIPGKTSAGPTAAAPSAATPAVVAETLSYSVKAGDTLVTIARRAGTTASALKTINKLKSDALRVGQTLTIPAGSANASAIATAAPAAPATAPSASAPATTHVIKPGETLGVIARKYQVKVGDLATANNIADPTKIRVGQELKIPGGKAAGLTSKAASETVAPRLPAPEPVAPAAPAINPIFAEPANPIMGTPEPASPVGISPVDAPVISIEDAPPISVK
jgi:LysM repeat protein